MRCQLRRRENIELSTKQPASALRFAGRAVAMIAKCNRLSARAKLGLKGLEEVSTDTDHQDWSSKTFPAEQVARTPKDRVEIFKEAVHKTYTDPELINEYRKLTGGDEPTPH